MKTIAIKTAQNVQVDYELAHTRDRIFAALIDVIAFTLLYYIAILVIASSGMNHNWFEGFGALFFLQLLPIFLFLNYLTFSEAFLGYSLGKKILGIRVVRIDGEQLTMSDHLMRAIFYLLDCLFTAGFLAIVMVMSTEKAQRLGDFAANTTVIKLRSSTAFYLGDILAISSLDNYEPVYPQVVHLKEEDMILVKNVIARYRKYNNSAHEKTVVDCVTQIQKVLSIEKFNGDYIGFLNTILKDYIVLTR